MRTTISLTLIGLMALAGCTTTSRGRQEAGFGSRTDYYVYTEAKDSANIASYTIEVKALVDHLVTLGLTKDQAEEVAEKAPPGSSLAEIAESLEEVQADTEESSVSSVDAQEMEVKIAEQDAIITAYEKDAEDTNDDAE